MSLAGVEQASVQAGAEFVLAVAAIWDKQTYLQGAWAAQLAEALLALQGVLQPSTQSGHH